MSLRNYGWYTNPERIDKMQEAINECSLVFVYGTLKRGYGNNTVLGDSEYVGERLTADNFYLGKMGCPFLFPEAVFRQFLRDGVEGMSGEEVELGFALKPVKGEVFKVTDPFIMSDLDNLEAEGFMYHRRLIQTSEGETVWSYQGLRPEEIRYTKPCEYTEGVWEYVRQLY